MKAFVKRINEFTLDFAHEPVPVDHTRPAWRLFGVWVVAIINLAFIAIGLTMAQSDPAVIFPALICGYAVVAFFICLSTYIGSRTRLPAARLLPMAMGRYPAAIFMTFIGLSSLGWFGFQLELFVDAIRTVIAPDNPESIPATALIVFGGLLMISSAVIGFRAIDWISQIGTPALLALMLWPVILYLSDTQAYGGIDVPGTGEGMSFGQAMSIFMGGAVTPMIIAPDISRYVRRPASAVTVTGLSVFLGCIGFIGLSIFLGYVSGAATVPALILAFNMGLLGFALVLIATWTTNDSNVYVASLAFTSVFRQMRKWQIALILGMIGISIALFGIVDRFVEWITLLGIVFPAGAAVFLTDYYMNPEKFQDAHHKDKDPVRWGAVIALICGIVTSYATSDPQTFGGGWFTLTTIPAVDGLISAGLIHLLLAGILRMRKG